MTDTPQTENRPTAAELEQARRDALRLKITRRKLGPSGRLGRAFLESKLTPLIIVASLLLGAFAIMVTPSEEEPQINVPMIDVLVGYPGATAEEVEYRVITPLEKLLYEIENVEYIYSTSSPSGGMIIVRFLVGTDPDQAALRVHTKIQAASDEMPPGAMMPVVKPRTIDDVPSVAYTLWGDSVGGRELRQVADELKVELTRHPRVAQVSVIGGQRRTARVDFDAQKLAAFNVSILQAYQAVESFNWRLPAGSTSVANREITVDVGQFLTSAADVAQVVVGVYGGKPVYLEDVATIVDATEEPADYVWLGTGPAAPEKGLDRAGIDVPAVTLAVAKKPGTNAVDMVGDLDRYVERLKGPVIPSNINVLKTRDYGATAKEKSNELLHHLLSATIAVVLLMWVTLSRREAAVVAVVIPVTLALTLAASYFFGYTLNRISLFALVFSIGILVDDAIVVVENIHRHFKLKWGEAHQVTTYALDEVGNPTILATFAIISALMPLAFVRGLMGPYMRPIPINASAAMLFSLAVAFTISPWLALRLFRKEFDGSEGDSDDEIEVISEEGRISRLYSLFMRPLIQSAMARYIFLAVVAGLLVASMGTVAVGFTTVKMLPHDNKSEVQIVIDAPEGFTLEQTNAAAREIASVFRTMPEVIDYQIYAGTSAPFNFNGLVRHYFMRSGPNVADIQVNFVHKSKRKDKSHALAKRVRTMILPIAEAEGVTITVAEIPPGPPVLSTLVAEIYGPSLEGRLEVAADVKQVFDTTDGVVDVDWFVEEPADHAEIRIDRVKAMRTGISPEQIVRTLRVALNGAEPGLLHLPTAREPVPITLRLDRSQRAHIDDLLQLTVHGGDGRMVPLSEVTSVSNDRRERFRYHKNLQPVTYVVGEVADRYEAPVYAILEMEKRLKDIMTPQGEELEIIATHMPEDTSRYIMKWDGEWHITYEVFRDMGIAFAVVMVLIYVLMVGWFKSFVTPIIIMVPIPLTLVGILPAHGGFSVFFTATSMIGFIALAGIIVRNSILLVDFINLEIRAGEQLEDAVVKAGAVRLVPIFLTQLSTIIGSSFMLSDPIFQGLALAMISGIIVSTALTLGVIPVLYYMFLKVVGTDTIMEQG